MRGVIAPAGFYRDASADFAFSISHPDELPGPFSSHVDPSPSPISRAPLDSITYPFLFPSFPLSLSPSSLFPQAAAAEVLKLKVDDIGQVSLNTAAEGAGEGGAAAAGGGTRGGGIGGSFVFARGGGGGGGGSQALAAKRLTSAVLELDAVTPYLPLLLHESAARNQKLGLAVALVQVCVYVCVCVVWGGEGVRLCGYGCAQGVYLGCPMWGCLRGGHLSRSRETVFTHLPTHCVHIHTSPNIPHTSRQAVFSTPPPHFPPQVGAWAPASTLMDRLSALGLPPAAWPPMTRALCSATAREVDALHSAIVPRCGGGGGAG